MMNRQLIILLLSTLGSGAAMADGVVSPLSDSGNTFRAPRFGALPPQQLQVIQAVGRSVLAARQSAIPDPNAEILRQKVTALGTELGLAVTAIAKTPPTLQMSKGRKVTALSSTPQVNLVSTTHDIKLIQNASGNFDQQEVTPSANNAPVVPDFIPHQTIAVTSGGADFSTVRARLDDVRQSSDAFKSKVQDKNSRGPSIVDLSSKSTALQDEVRGVLDGTAPSDGSTLNKLRDRLKPKSLSEVLADQQAAALAAGEHLPEPTPTISTLFRHR